jgi:hypothetical protein
VRKPLAVRLEDPLRGDMPIAVEIVDMRLGATRRVTLQKRSGIVIDNASDDPTCVLPFADQGTPP